MMMPMVWDVMADRDPTTTPTGVPRERRGLELFHVGNTWDHEAFRDYILRAAALVPNVERQADIARIIGTNPSMLSKWFRGQEQPSIQSLERVRDGFVASGVRVDLADLLALTGRMPRDMAGADAGESRSDPVAVIGHRLARELDAMLADASPIPADKRAVLETFVDQVLENYRPLMRRRRSA